MALLKGNLSRVCGNKIEFFERSLNEIEDYQIQRECRN